MLIKASTGAIQFSSQPHFADVNETILSYIVVEVILSSHWCEASVFIIKKNIAWVAYY